MCFWTSQICCGTTWQCVIKWGPFVAFSVTLSGGFGRQMLDCFTSVSDRIFPLNNKCSLTHCRTYDCWWPLLTGVPPLSYGNLLGHSRFPLACLNRGQACSYVNLLKSSLEKFFPLYLFSQVWITSFACLVPWATEIILLRAPIWPGVALYVQYVNADLSNSSAGGDISLLLISCIYSATLNSPCPLRNEHHLHAHIWVFPLSLIGSVCVCADDGLLAVWLAVRSEWSVDNCHLEATLVETRFYWISIRQFKAPLFQLLHWWRFYQPQVQPLTLIMCVVLCCVCCDGSAIATLVFAPVKIFKKKITALCKINLF